MEFPRRIQLEKMVPAELRIRDAILEVERLGADVRLTDAVILLGKAKDKVADYVDDPIPENSLDPPEWPSLCPVKHLLHDRVLREYQYLGDADPRGMELRQEIIRRMKAQ